MSEVITSNYPASLDDTTSLLNDQVNNKSFELNGDHNNSTTTIITSATIAGISAPNYVFIDSEVVHFTGISGASFTGCTRGADGTTAASHNNGASIYHIPVANWGNQLRRSIIATQTELGTNPSGDETNVTTRFDVVNYPEGSMLTISNGEITLSESKTYFQIATEGGASEDDLNTINGGSDGRVIVLSMALGTGIGTGDDVALTTSGNLENGDYGKITLDSSNEIAVYRYEVSRSKWILLSTNINQLTNRYCILAMSSDQSIPTSTYTDIEWDNEQWDIPGWHDNSVNPEDITIDKSGIYLVTLKVRFHANATGYREIAILQGVSKAAYDSRDAQSSGWTNCSLSTVLRVSASTVLSAQVYQTSGGSLDIDNQFGYMEVVQLL